MTKHNHTIVFDLGNVLIRWDPRNLYRKLFTNPSDMEWFLTHVCNQEWNEQQDAGRPIAVATAELTKRHPEHADLIRDFYGRWHEMLGGEISENVAVLAELRREGRPIYALSNWSAETFHIAKGRFEFLQWFSGIVLSGEEKLIKPDPRFYQILLDRYAIKAETVIFIDDSLKNIEAAKRLGMRTIHFTAGVDLREKLRLLLGGR